MLNKDYYPELMSNFLTYNKWPLRRIIGALLAVISIFLQAPIFAEIISSRSGSLLGYLIGIAIWGYILFRLLKAPDESKTWKGIPHSWFAILLYMLLVIVVSVSTGTHPIELSKAQQADACITRKIEAKENMANAAEDCMKEAGMTAEDQRLLMINTISMGDTMTIPERIEWCKNFLPHVWEDPSTLKEACDYTANNWQEAKKYLLEQLNDPPYAVE